MLHLVRSYTTVCVVIWPRSEQQMGISESCAAQWVKSASEPGQTDFPSTLTISVSEIMAVGFIMSELIFVYCNYIY